jgi:hypothetical protein
VVTPAVAIPSPELAVVLERIRVRLLEVPPDALHAIGSAVAMGVAASFTKKGRRSEPVAFVARWKDAATLRRALAKGSLEILECGLWLLESVDRDRALDEAIAICALPAREPREAVDFFEPLVRARAQHVVSRNADLLPVPTLLDLAARGELSVSLAKEALPKHPALRTGEELARALQRTPWAATLPDDAGYPRDRDLAEYFLASLRALADAAAVPPLEAIFRAAGSHEVRWTVARTLEDLGSTLPSQALIAAATEGRLEEEGPIDAAGRRRWPPILRWAISAVVAAAPRTAYDQLARYLESPRLTEEFVTHGLITTVADAIAAVLEPSAAARKHASEADPRWAVLIARMAASDPWWKRYARRFESTSRGAS